MQTNKIVNCQGCFKMLATIDGHLNVIEENEVSKISNKFSVGPQEVEEVKLTCSYGTVATLYGC